MKRTTATPPKRGRPFKYEAAKRQDKFLNHCLAQFMKLGYRNATMDGLAATFGASKSTIYRRYGSKAGLLRTVMARGVPMLREPLKAVSTDARRTPRAVLHDYATLIQNYANDPNIRAMWRAVSEAREDLGDALDEVARMSDEIQTPIVAYLAELDRSGRLAVGNAKVAATCFTELASGGVSNFLGRPRDARERRSAANFAVDLFLKGTLPRLS